MKLLRNNCHIRANVATILVAANGRAMQMHCVGRVTRFALTRPTNCEKGDSVDVEFYRPVPDSVQGVPDTEGKVPDSAQAVPDSEGKVPDSAAARTLSILQHIDQHGRISAPEVAVMQSDETYR